MATIDPQAVSPEEVRETAARVPELRIYTHSSLLYWWPVWFVGYIIAAYIYLEGVPIQIDGREETFAPTKNPGVVFSVVLFLVIWITNVAVRGLASVVAIISILFLTVLFAYLDWWDEILSWLPKLTVHMNLGFYLFFSTLMLLAWMGAVLIMDHMSFWRIRPGQITHEYIIGGAEKSYDTRGMVFEQFHGDFFRHWVLGLGTGDLKINTTGARREEVVLPNVLWVDAKVKAIQRLISVRPDQVGSPID